MTYNELNDIRQLPDDMLQKLLLEFFRLIDREHEESFQAFGRFGIEDTVLGDDGKLRMEGVAIRRLNRESRMQNYKDYAGVVYMICTGEKWEENMEPDVLTKIKIPTLRQIVRVFGFRNELIGQLVYNLRTGIYEQPFFSGASTGSEGNAAKESQKSSYGSKGSPEMMAHAMGSLYPRRSKWRWVGWFFLVGIVTVVLRTCQSGGGGSVHTSMPSTPATQAINLPPQLVMPIVMPKIPRLNVDSLRSQFAVHAVGLTDLNLNSTNRFTLSMVDSLLVHIRQISPDERSKVRPILFEMVKAGDWEGVKDLLDSIKLANKHGGIADIESNEENLPAEAEISVKPPVDSLDIQIQSDPGQPETDQ